MPYHTSLRFSGTVIVGAGVVAGCIAVGVARFLGIARKGVPGNGSGIGDVARVLRSLVVMPSPVPETVPIGLCDEQVVIRFDFRRDDRDASRIQRTLGR